MVAALVHIRLAILVASIHGQSSCPFRYLAFGVRGNPRRHAQWALSRGRPRDVGLTLGCLRYFRFWTTAAPASRPSPVGGASASGLCVSFRASSAVDLVGELRTALGAIPLALAICLCNFCQENSSATVSSAAQHLANRLELHTLRCPSFTPNASLHATQLLGSFGPLLLASSPRHALLTNRTPLCPVSSPTCQIPGRRTHRDTARSPAPGIPRPIWETCRRLTALYSCFLLFDRQPMWFVPLNDSSARL